MTMRTPLRVVFASAHVDGRRPYVAVLLLMLVPGPLSAAPVAEPHWAFPEAIFLAEISRDKPFEHGDLNRICTRQFSGQVVVDSPCQTCAGNRRTAPADAAGVALHDSNKAPMRIAPAPIPTRRSTFSRKTVLGRRRALARHLGRR